MINIPLFSFHWQATNFKLHGQNDGYHEQSQNWSDLYCKSCPASTPNWSLCSILRSLGAQNRRCRHFNAITNFKTLCARTGDIAGIFRQQSRARCRRSPHSRHKLQWRHWLLQTTGWRTLLLSGALERLWYVKQLSFLLTSFLNIEKIECSFYVFCSLET